jgi:tRNA(Ile)-lysidine synthase
MMKKNQKDIYSRVFEFISKNELVSANDNILLALSAGKDSMALLDIFLHLQHRFAINLAVFHLNHKMRGDESDVDESFVEQAAHNNNLKYHAFEFDFIKNMPKGYSFEEYARQKRYELLNQVCSDNNYNKIATAHNSDDNIETILMRIFTGTGINGLRGIDYKRNNIIRPMLFLSVKEIYDHLKERKIKWREDSSNKDTKYLRNYLRSSILPEIYNRFERADESILALSGIAGELTDLILEFVQQNNLISKSGNIVFIDLEKIKDKRLFKFILADAFSKFGRFVTGSVLEEIYRKAYLNKSHLPLYELENFFIRKTLKNNKKVIVISEDIGYYITNWEYAIDLKSAGKNSIYVKEIDRTFYFQIIDYEFFVKNRESNIIFIALNEDTKRLLIRNRQNGDKINLEFGCKKVKDLLIDYKLDKRSKNILPLLVIDSHVAALLSQEFPGRVSVDFHVKENTKKILAIHSDKYQL